MTETPARPARVHGSPAESASPRPDWRLRLRVRLRRSLLDHEIAAGAHVEDLPARTLRASQLTSTASRRELAAALANILDAAEECRVDRSTRLILEHAAVIEARELILQLIARLGDGAPLDHRGVALTRVIVYDRRRSPMFSAGCERTLGQALSEIADAL